MAGNAPCRIDQAFAAFTEERLYRRWLGVPVSLQGDQFRGEMEWGAVVRGTYDAVFPPRLIVMTWDIGQAEAPAPGAGDRAYLFLSEDRDNPDRCRVEMQQFVAGTEQARFMDRAWRLVLGRFLSRIVDALDPAVTLAPFPPRPRAVEPESVG